jgi:UDP-N-acetylglucosamine 2-epimerase (non-hydrolysing)
MKTILFIYGTRPEAIKMAPLINELKNEDKCFKIEICLTGQHRQMLDSINDFFNIKGDFDLALMSNNQSIFDITSRCLLGLQNILESQNPDLIFVQGDTTTVMSAALSSFYKKIPIAHLEAGLRSGNKYSPFPEELNRIITGHIADYHFAPTQQAIENLASEGITKNVFLVGNTVIDALYMGLDIIKSEPSNVFMDFFSFLDFSKKIILVTGHRRESFGQGFDDICNAIKYLAENFKNIEIVYPVHLNPNVREPVNRKLSNIDNIHLIEPLDYPYLIWLMNKSFFVLTDSGGIQEEAPALGKPVLVMRDVTERIEGVQAGTAKLVGTNYTNIIEGASELLLNPSLYSNMSNSINPYGDGTASKKIVAILKDIFAE